MDFLWRLTDTSGFPPRWHCGVWTSGHGWLHILSDIGIGSAYCAIPLMLWWVTRRHTTTQFRSLFVLFASFIIFCSSTHFMEAVIFWWPAYRLAGVLKLMTAIISWATVIALVRVAPKALTMRTHEELEAEVAARHRAERELIIINSSLEERVQQRVRELAAANIAIEQQREWFRTTLASIGDAVIATDSESKIIIINDVAAELTGWPAELAVGERLEAVFHIIDEATGEPVLSPASAALKDEIIVSLPSCTLLVSRGGQQIPIADSAAPIRNAQGEITGAVVVFRNVTENRRMEERYRQSQKMEAIGRFAGGIAHDFNNLLTVINGYCQLLEADSQLAAGDQEFLGEIHRAGSRAAALTGQLLAFSRMQQAKPQILDLNGIVASISRMLERLIGEDFVMRSELAGDLWLTKADCTQIEQILVNLTVNARDAMPSGGEIHLKTSNITVTPSNQSSYPEVPPGQFVQLTFRDSGSGMDENVRSRAFEPYFTTKESGKGTGLGLATVFGIVQQSQGFIGLESKVGAGTTFRIYLPRFDDKECLSQPDA